MEWLGLYDQISVAEVEQFDRLANSRLIKREWIVKGYDKQLSLYGAVHDTETDEDQYRRIDILSNTPFTQELVTALYEFFAQFPLINRYTIWIYDKDKDSVAQVDAYG